MEAKDKYVSENDFLQQILALSGSNKRAFSLALKSLFIGFINLLIEIVVIVWLLF